LDFDRIAVLAVVLLLVCAVSYLAGRRQSSGAVTSAASVSVSGTRAPLDPLALLFVAGFMAFAFALLFVEVPEKNTTLVNMIAGSWITFVGAITSFRWGSSDGSKNKDVTIAKVITEAPQSPTPP
jgi:hypothetical protein